jgi:hypothetical protein
VKYSFDLNGGKPIKYSNGAIILTRFLDRKNDGDSEKMNWSP